MKQVIFLTLDSSQHFRGYHYPVLQVMLTERTLTNNQMADLIEYEINDNWDMYFHGYPEHEALYTTFIAELRKDGEALFFQADESLEEYFETIENEEYLDDYLYFFFSIGEPNTVDGLTFCDNPKLIEMLENVIEPSSFICTYVASAVKMLEGDKIKIYGFSKSENPDAKYFVEDNGDDSDEGHHFAVMSDRYIIDPWVFDNFNRSVFDLQNKNDEEMVRYLYGDRNKWTDITNRVEDFKDMFPKTYNELLNYYTNIRN